MKEIDSLIFMGFGGFSIFASMFASADSGQTAPWASSREAFHKVASTFIKVLRSGDAVEIGKFIQPVVAGLASRMGTYQEEEISDLTEIIATAIASGRLDVPFVVSAFLPPDSEALAEIPVEKPPTTVEAVAHFLVAIADQWVASYGKPVITTTVFAEDQPRLRGSHYAYPSGRHAARVLIKMLEYREYLETIGAYKV